MSHFKMFIHFRVRSFKGQTRTGSPVQEASLLATVPLTLLGPQYRT